MKKLVVAVTVVISSFAMFSCSSHGYHSSGSGCYISYEDNSQKNKKERKTIYSVSKKEITPEYAADISCQ